MPSRGYSKGYYDDLWTKSLCDLGEKLLKEKVTSFLRYFERKNIRRRKLMVLGLHRDDKGHSRLNTIDRETDEMTILANSLISHMIMNLRPEFRWTTLLVINLSENSDETNRHIRDIFVFPDRHKHLADAECEDLCIIPLCGKWYEKLPENKKELETVEVKNKNKKAPLPHGAGGEKKINGKFIVKTNRYRVGIPNQ